MHPARRPETEEQRRPSFHRRLNAALWMAAVLQPAAPAWGQASSDPRGPLTLLLLLPVALVSFTALELVLWVLAPTPLSATCRQIARGRGRCLLVGVVAAGVALALMSGLGKEKGAGERAAALVPGLLALGALTGLTAVISLLGHGVVELAGRSGSRALSVVIGSVLLGCAVLFPLIGQVLGIYFVLVGLGGALLALMRPGAPGKP